MPALSSRSKVEELLATADVRVDGDRPWDVQVHEPRFFARVLAQGSLGLGESYMDGWWDAPSLDGFLYQLLHAHVDERVHGLGDVVAGLKARVVNLQSMRRAFTVGRRHYDLGNDLYSVMLGQRLVYSCAYWRDRSEEHTSELQSRLHLVCRLLLEK